MAKYGVMWFRQLWHNMVLCGLENNRKYGKDIVWMNIRVYTEIWFNWHHCLYLYPYNFIA